MCCLGDTSGSRMTRCGVICGLAALTALTTALFGPAWLHTEERIFFPHLLPHLTSAMTIKFKLGLFRVCPRIINLENITISKYSIFLMEICV